MAKYSDIKGFTVQTLSTDTVASQQLGGSWASGNALNTGRRDAGGAGTQTAAQFFFGLNPAPTALALNEYYDGTSWSEQADANTARAYGGGIGQTQTASLFAGGYSSTSHADVEVWDGSSWTEVNNINTARENLCNSTAGSSTSGLIFGGYSGGAVGITEEWDGSSWTESGDLNNAAYEVAGTGIQTAALRAGGNPRSTNVEQYNGSSWTEITEINTAKTGASAAGLYTDAIVFGGNTAPGGTFTAQTEFWNGTSWTELNDLSAAKTLGNTGMGTTTSSSIYMGGIAPPNTITGTTEEWTAPSDFNQIQEGQLFFNSTANAFKETINDLTGGTWASGGALNNGRTGVSGARNTPGHGTGLAMAGFTTPPLTARGYTEEYDGTSWTEDTDMNLARGQTSGTGTSATAGIVYGGETYPPPVNKTNTETWNGSSWTEVNDLNTAGRSMGNCGTTTAALAIAGTPGGDREGKTEIWDGTSWTESGDVPSVPAGLSYNCAFGTTTAATTTGGGPGPAGYKRKAWSWTGSSWSEIAENNSDKTGGMAFGSNANSGFAFVSSTTEFWNGTSWTEVNDQSTGKTEGGSGGVSDSGLAFGGPSNETATEEWTAGLANKTITAS